MSMKRLLEIMEKLRDPVDGCPWDRQQDFASLVPYTIEEAYEVADTIAQQDYAELCDELGDLLFQVVFYAQIARERQLFDFNDVATAIADKLIRRHPHVFADERIESAEKQTQAWEEHKRQERAVKAGADAAAPSELDGIVKSLPALVRAQKLQRRAARVGFDWDDIEAVYAKLFEEVDEVREAAQSADLDKLEDEVGDLLFAGVNLARFLNIDAEHALRRANGKFEQRFREVETRVAAEDGDMQAMSVTELDDIWEAVKRRQHKDLQD
jgi:MazG family protein